MKNRLRVTSAGSLEREHENISCCKDIVQSYEYDETWNKNMIFHKDLT